MADLAATLTAIAGGLAALPGLTADQHLRVHADGLWPDTVNPPAALIEPTTSEPLSVDESDLIEHIRVIVVVRGGGPYESAQKALLPYCANTGASSVSRAALRTAMGSALISIARRKYGTCEIGDLILAGAAWDPEVICQRRCTASTHSACVSTARPARATWSASGPGLRVTAATWMAPGERR